MSDSPPSHSGTRRLVVVLAVAGAAVAIGWFVFGSRPSVDELLRDGRAAFTEGRYEEAANLAGQILNREPDHTGALLLAGESAAQREDFETAVEFFERIPDGDSDESLASRRNAGRVHLEHLRRLSDAERCFRDVLEHEPDDLVAARELTTILVRTARFREAVPYLLRLARQETVDPQILLQLNSPAEVVGEEAAADFLRECRDAAPQDPLPLLGLAQLAVQNERWTEAIELVRTALELDPELLTAHELLGRALLGAVARDELTAWEDSLPAGADESADIWALRGDRANRTDQPQRAIRCYWEALKRDADQPRALRALPELLVAEGFEEQARNISQRGNLQERADSLLAPVVDGELDPENLKQVVDALQAMGRIVEANGWLEIILQQSPEDAWAQQRSRQLQPRLRTSNAKTFPRFNPVRSLDFSGDPSEWPTANRTGPRHRVRDDISTSIRFADVAGDAHLQFHYFNGAPRDAQTYRMMEFTGGGVAVLDYDADGWPDLYLTQGSLWPPDPANSSEYRDRLYRNVSGERFVDVTEQAGLGDESYSQGATVGDFNGDGFPDLYLANIGRNRLYQNLGDGTFADVSVQIRSRNERWTTSCLMADLNGDALPDLYDVNYLQGHDVFTRTCRTPEGKTSSCLPISFAAAPDRLSVNQGNGEFVDATESAGIVAERGNGLGIVALDLQGEGRLSLFVANDQTPNHLYVNQSSGPSAEPKFAEQAMVAGVAVDRAGRDQACMGVACGDVDGNGLPDFFISNFANEQNTLYLQHSGELFLDATQSAGLLEPSLEFLGFGTQFLDADLDGWLDVIVTNGNIDDSGGPGSMFEMRPQFFLNRGRGKFVELSAEHIGDFFSRARLGRGLALTDWNRDGRFDAVISHLDDHTALLENQTTEPGNYLSLSFVGVASERQAIGTRVSVVAGERTLTAQLTAGDGYMASNERRVILGLGKLRIAESVTIRWPAGTEQVFNNVSVNGRYTVIEGRGELYEDTLSDRIQPNEGASNELP